MEDDQTETPSQSQINKATGIKKDPELVSLGELYTLEQNTSVIDSDGNKTELLKGQQVRVRRL